MSWWIDEAYWPGPLQEEEFLLFHVVHALKTASIGRRDSYYIFIDREEIKDLEVGMMISIFPNITIPVGVVKKTGQNAVGEFYIEVKSVYVA